MRPAGLATIRLRCLSPSRISESTAAPLGLDRAFSDGRLRTFTIGPLSLGAIQKLLRDRLGTALPRPLLRRVHETSGGNPFFALELARALGEARPEPGQDLPVPATLHELVQDRLAALRSPTEQALRVAALLADPLVDLVVQGADAGSTSSRTFPDRS
jgi:hypothetical protein